MPTEQSYYDRNKEARKAYQKTYYAERQGELRRKRELEPLLHPDKYEKKRAYQREYYLTFRAKLLSNKRIRYRDSGMRDGG